MPKFCYQIHTHRDPDQVYRLVDAIQRSSTDPLVVVSNTLDGPPLDAHRLNRHGEVLVRSTEGGYADWSHVRRYLEVVELLRERGLDYEWMINITGQDYPVRPMRDAEAELERCETDGFVEHFAVLSDKSPWGRARGRSRYWFHYRTLRTLQARTKRRLRPVRLLNGAQPMVRVNLTKGLSLGWRARTPFGPDLVCHGGSAYASVRRECAEYALDITHRRPDIVRHYTQTLSPAESFLQTVWLGGGRFRFVDDCKRYFDFSRTTLGHPEVLTIDDVEPARRAGAHFGRKFDLNRDPAAFDLMDRYVLDAGPESLPT